MFSFRVDTPAQNTACLSILGPSDDSFARGDDAQDGVPRQHGQAVDPQHAVESSRGAESGHGQDLHAARPVQLLSAGDGVYLLRRHAGGRLVRSTSTPPRTKRMPLYAKATCVPKAVQRRPTTTQVTKSPMPFTVAGVVHQRQSEPPTEQSGCDATTVASNPARVLQKA